MGHRGTGNESCDGSAGVTVGGNAVTGIGEMMSSKGIDSATCGTGNMGISRKRDWSVTPLGSGSSSSM